MIDYFDFEEIRPFNTAEFAAAWGRIKNNETFHSALSFLFSEERIESFNSRNNSGMYICLNG